MRGRSGGKREWGDGSPMVNNVVHNTEYFVFGFGAEEGDARLLEIIEPFENG